MTANLLADAREQLQGIITAAYTRAFPDSELRSFNLEIPKDTSHGDFASNVAMMSAKAVGKPPREIAAALIAGMDFAGSYFSGAEAAGPGFINFTLNGSWFSHAVQSVLDCGADYGRSNYGAGEKVMVEFVSANPTGPMHMGNARGGAIGDCLASALDFAGYDVTREFYINDAGNQIAKFGRSLEARYLQLYLGEDAVEFPEEGYQGEDIKVRAQEFANLHGERYVNAPSEERIQALVDYALPANVEGLRRDLEKYRIHYDVWFSEKSLHDSGAVMEAVKLLTARGMTYEKEGAIWYKATEYGAEKDEVLVRANGIPTYFTADIAYHYNKFAIRGFNRVIDIWGADHHGHVARMKGAMNAVGLDGDKLDIVLMQLVRLMKDGQPFKMSKRTGKAITLTDLLEDIPIDAARFFFNMREAGSTLDFDLDLAVEQTNQNPVYYVQYAHARICSILKNLAAEGIAPRPLAAADFDCLTAGEERELIRKLASMPEEIISAARSYDPARMTHYVIDTATLFHKFYNACRVKGDNEALMQARLGLCIATRTVIANTLGLLKITAPESM